jgi:hypothetical protein
MENLLTSGLPLSFAVKGIAAESRVEYSSQTESDLRDVVA